AHETDARAEAPERRRGIGRRDRPASRTAGRDQAHVPVLLHAEPDRFPPGVRLVVVVAARVDTHVAADRSHTPELGRRDEPRIRAVIVKILHRVADGARREIRERRQPHHDPASPNGRTATASAGWPNADSTTIGSLNVKSGSLSGPTRAGFPRTFASSPRSS